MPRFVHIVPIDEPGREMVMPAYEDVDNKLSPGFPSGRNYIKCEFSKKLTEEFLVEKK